MNEVERASLKSQIDQVVVMETVQGERLTAQLLFVYDEGDTPDLFCIEVEPTASGYVKKADAGHSILLSDILTVHPAPPLPSP